MIGRRARWPRGLVIRRARCPRYCQATHFVGIAAIVANEMLALVGGVLGKLGQEVQRLEKLEVAFDAAEEVFAGGAREALDAVLLGLVENLAGGGDADQPGKAERAASHVLGKAFDRDIWGHLTR